MNNEPVAWINVEKRRLEWDKPTLWETPTVVNLDRIPLYTHPVKELTVPDGLIDPKSYYIGYEDGKNKSQADIEYEADKAYWRNRTLTDEEITDVFVECLLPYGEFDEHEFARAILRKAQEK